MARGDKRRSPKMRRIKSRNKMKARAKARMTATKATRKS